jgi:hypothetical protein
VNFKYPSARGRAQACNPNQVGKLHSLMASHNGRRRRLCLPLSCMVWLLTSNYPDAIHTPDPPCNTGQELMQLTRGLFRIYQHESIHSQRSSIRCLWLTLPSIPGVCSRLCALLNAQSRLFPCMKKQNTLPVNYTSRLGSYWQEVSARCSILDFWPSK